MRGKMCVYVCVSQAGRAREGRARRSHRVRTDVVLTAQKGDAQGRAGRWLSTWAHGITAFTNNKTTTTPIVTNLDVVIRH